MNGIKKGAAVIAATLLSLGGISGLAQTAEASPLNTQILIRCDFYANNQCYDHWIPTKDSCRNIANVGTATQLRQCLALFKYGITKK